jgi:hypothetical protein
MAPLYVGHTGKNLELFQPPEPPWCDTPKRMATAVVFAVTITGRTLQVDGGAGTWR